MVPVRFDQATRRKIAAAAKVAGKSVSAWIRDAVEMEIRRA
jgi:predicted HicB family RNase H-like nuclease